MKTNIEKILKFVVLLLLWALFSPLFLFLTIRWKIMVKGWRTALFALSPFMLFVYFMLTVLVVWVYSEYNRKFGYSSNSAIERITGVDFPRLNIIEYNKGIKSFNGDYTDSFVLEMESKMSESTYRVLDSLALSNNSYWSFYDGEYRFSIIWGNGAVAPEGEDPNEDRTLSLSFKKGCRIVNLSTGMW